MSGNIDIRLFGKKPFPPDHIFDSLRQFDPIQINQNVRSNTSGTALNQIDSFFCKVSNLLRQVNSLSWLYVVWREKFVSSGELSPEDKAMTVILLECILILTQERDSMTDRIERIQRLFQLEAMITTLGIPDSAWMISNVFIGTKVVPLKRNLRQFSKYGHTRTSKICSLSQSLQYVMLFIKVRLQCYF